MKRLLNNPLYKMVGIFVIAYGALLLLGSVAKVEDGYRSAIQGVSNKVFRNFWSNGLVFFEDGQDPLGEEMDTAIRMINREAFIAAKKNQTTVYSIRIFCSMRNWGFLITAFFIALVLAAPVPLRRKLISGTIGLLLVQLFVLFRIWVDIEFSMQQNQKLDIVNYGGFGEQVIVTMDAVFAKNIVVAFSIPLLIWIFVMFKREDVKMLGNAVANRKDQ